MTQIVALTPTKAILPTPRLDLAHVAAALTRQVVRDFGPLCGVDAKVIALKKGDPLPSGAWPLFLSSHPIHGVEDGHSHEADGRPFAVVLESPTWTIDLSHELLEMLANPLGERTISGPSPVPGQGRVLFSAEPCDPVDGQSYVIDGVHVSNFCTPSYYQAGFAPWDQAGVLAGPHEIARFAGRLEWTVPGPPVVAWHRYFTDQGACVTEPVGRGTNGRPLRTSHFHRPGAPPA